MKNVKQELVSNEMLHNYFGALVGKFFKILPLRESMSDTIGTYVESLQMELLGFHALMAGAEYDQRLLSLISFLQYMIDNPDCDIPIVKREVFRAIRLCNDMDSEYGLVTSVKGGASNESLGVL